MRCWDQDQSMACNPTPLSYSKEKLSLAKEEWNLFYCWPRDLHIWSQTQHWWQMSKIRSGQELIIKSFHTSCDVGMLLSRVLMYLSITENLQNVRWPVMAQRKWFQTNKLREGLCSGSPCDKTDENGALSAWCLSSNWSKIQLCTQPTDCLPTHVV